MSLESRGFGIIRAWNRKMDEKEKLAFLKRMGLPMGRIGKTDEEIRRRTRTDNRVEKSDLIDLARK